MKKILFIVALLSMLIFGATNIKALTAQELQTQIQALLQQIEQLQKQLKETGGNSSGVAWCHNFTKNLRIEENDFREVVALHQALSKEGFDIPMSEDETSSFGEFTASAVSEFQEKYASEILKPSGLKKGTGYVGPSTRKKLNALYGCSNARPVCTQDAKQCPDGSYVSRTGANCEFANCPDTGKQCQTTKDCPQLNYYGAKTKCVDGKCVTENTLECKNLWWYDNTNKTCQQKQFCGTYMYLGLKTFQEKINCENSLAGTYDPDLSCSCVAWGEWGSCINGYQTQTCVTPSSGNCGIQGTTRPCTTTQPSITVTSPNGGEKIKMGETYVIKWDSSGYDSNYYASISLVNMDNFVEGRNENYFPITTTSLGVVSGAYNWKLPTTETSNGGFTLRPGNNYKIVVGIVDRRKCTASCFEEKRDFSDNVFSIISAQIIVCSSNLDCGVNNSQSVCEGGNSVYKNVTYICDNPGTIDSTCNTSTVTTLRNVCISGQICSNGLCSGQTDNITITSPKGGEQWVQNSTYNINWTFPQSFKDKMLNIDLVGGGLGSVRVVSNILTSTGYYSWKIPTQYYGDSTVGNDFKLYISVMNDSLSGSISGSSSNDYFSIIAPTISLVSKESQIASIYQALQNLLAQLNGR